MLFTTAYPQLIAGSQKLFLDLIIELPPSIQAIVVLTQDGIVADFLRKAGVHCIVVPPPPALDIYGKKILQYSIFKLIKVFFWDYLKYSFQLVKLLKKEEIDLIFCNDPRSVILWGLAKKIQSTPMVSQVHTENAIGSFFWNIFQSIPNQFTAVSEAVKKQLNQKNQKNTKVIYPYPIIEKLSHKEAVSPWINYHKKKGYTIIMCFSSLMPMKGLHHLLDAMNEMKVLNAQYMVLCFGSILDDFKEYVDYLYQKRDEYNLDNITFVDWVERPLDYMQLADIVLLPSIQKEELKIKNSLYQIKSSEGFPLVVLEAMALGKVIIASNLAGTPEQINDEVNGFLIPPSNAHAIQEKLALLIQQKELVKKIQEEAKKDKKSTYSKEKYIQQYIEILHK